MLASQTESQDTTYSFLSAGESSTDNTLNNETWNDGASNDTDDHVGIIINKLYEI